MLDEVIKYHSCVWDIFERGFDPEAGFPPILSAVVCLVSIRGDHAYRI